MHLKQTIMSKPLAGHLGGLVLFVLGGCLVSGTKFFEEEIGDIAVQGGIYGSQLVNLAKHDTFKKYQDEIELVDRVGFTTEIDNHKNEEATLWVYFSTEAGLMNPAKEATPLFLNVTIPAGGRTITYDESLTLIQDFPSLQNAIESGVLTLYFTASEGFNLLMNDFTVIVTFTACS